MFYLYKYHKYFSAFIQAGFCLTLRLLQGSSTEISTCSPLHLMCSPQEQSQKNRQFICCI